MKGGETLPATGLEGKSRSMMHLVKQPLPFHTLVPQYGQSGALLGQCELSLRQGLVQDRLKVSVNNKLFLRSYEGLRIWNQLSLRRVLVSRNRLPPPSLPLSLPRSLPHSPPSGP